MHSHVIFFWVDFGISIFPPEEPQEVSISGADMKVVKQPFYVPSEGNAMFAKSVQYSR